MTTLLFVEHGNGQIKDGTLKALTAARTIGASIHALVLGAGSRPVAEAAARLDGIEKVLNAEDGTYDIRPRRAGGRADRVARRAVHDDHRLRLDHR